MDHAAATAVDPNVLQAMQPYFSELFYNPSALYGPAQAVADDIRSARETVAAVMGARPVEIIFTAGGTEANNMAIHGIMQQFDDGHIVVSAVEHDSVLEPARKYAHTEVGVDQSGMVQIPALQSAITDQTVLVSIMYANNEIGTVEPIREIAALIATIRKDRQKRGNKRPLYFHTDASQAANYLDMHVSRLGLDLLSLNGGKIYGPKQSGVLYVRGGVPLRPLIYGGGQERGLRSGTENVAGVIGLAVALQLTQQQRTDEVRRLQVLQQQFITTLRAAIPTAMVNGSVKKRLPNNVHITIPGADNERLLFGLDSNGILAAAGSACSASNDEPSHVLSAIGLSDAEARASLRFSMGRATTAEDVAATVRVLLQLTSE